jgi:hypothetical protein
MRASGKLQREVTQAPGLDHDELVLRTPLGRRLWSLRQEVVRSGTPLLDWESLKKEVAERRGESEC